MSEKLYYTAEEISKMIGVGKTSAYAIVKKLNKELSDKGYIVVSGKIPKKYFNEKYFGGAVVQEVLNNGIILDEQG